MVVLHVKRGDADEWLFECAAADSCDTVIQQLCEIGNARCKLRALVRAATDLLQNGRWLGDEAPQQAADGDGPESRRAGTAVEPDLAGPLHAALNDAEAALAPAAAAAGVAASVAGTLALLAGLRAAADAALAPSGGLYPGDPVAAISAPDPGDAMLRAQLGGAYLDGATAELWWAGKPFARGGATIGDRAGRNDKTKLVAKLQPPGAGAPPREPAVSDAERAAMMAWYFKKMEEAKALADDRDDRYLSSPWTDTRALKTALNGTGAISWRPTA